MCLLKITQKNALDTPAYQNERVAYKVMEKCGKPGFVGGLYIRRSWPNPVLSPDWLTAQDLPLFNPSLYSFTAVISGEVYPPGFHCYLTYEDAVRCCWMGDPWKASSRVIVKVLVREVHTEGLDGSSGVAKYFLPVLVARQLKFLEVL